MPCVACREVVVDAVYATVHTTDDYLWWASSHCAGTSCTANGDLARPQDGPTQTGTPRSSSHVISPLPLSHASEACTSSALHFD